MSKNIEEIKQTDSFSKDNLPKGEINPDFPGTNHKIFYDRSKKNFTNFTIDIFNCNSLYFLCLFIIITKIKIISKFRRIK